MIDSELQAARVAESMVLKMPQIACRTWHVLHGGIYSRTVVLEAGDTIVGAEILVPTTLFISGNLKIKTGGNVIDVYGTQVLAAGKGRKQVMHAVERTTLTMSFVTSAKTIEEAEDEFTNESEKLMSRLPESNNYINITGE